MSDDKEKLIAERDKAQDAYFAAIDEFWRAVDALVEQRSHYDDGLIDEDGLIDHELWPFVDAFKAAADTLRVARGNDQRAWSRLRADKEKRARLFASLVREMNSGLSDLDPSELTPREREQLRAMAPDVLGVVSRAGDEVAAMLAD